MVYLVKVCGKRAYARPHIGTMFGMPLCGAAISEYDWAVVDTEPKQICSRCVSKHTKIIMSPKPNPTTPQSSAEQMELL